MHIFITEKAFDTLFDTHFSQGLMGPKCLNMGLYAAYKEILAYLSAFFDVNFDTDFASRISMQPIHRNWGRNRRKSISDLRQLLLQMAFL